MSAAQRPVVRAYDAPADNAAAVTPDDDTDLTYVTRGLYVGSAGDVCVTMGGGDIVFASVPAGTVLPVEVARVKATGTTAADIVALW